MAGNHMNCPFCFQPLTDVGPCPYCGHQYGEKQSDSRRLPAGTVLKGRYRLGLSLGQGGYGITYLAMDQMSGQRVTIKEFFPNGVAARRQQMVIPVTLEQEEIYRKGMEAFYHEAELLWNFRTHPNIVHILAFFYENNTAYFVTDYTEGMTLDRYLESRGGKLNPAETFAFLEPVMTAVEEMHEAGILHRDIAPDNIIVSWDGVPKLTDFGAARAESDRGVIPTEAVLKPGYTPVEQYAVNGNLGPWTDVYAMGAVIYKCLSGRTIPDAPARLQNPEITPLKEIVPGISGKQSDAVMKALSFSMQDRYSSMQAFYDALFSKKDSGKKPAWLLPVIISLAVLLLAGGVWFFFLRDGDVIWTYSSGDNDSYTETDEESLYDEDFSDEESDVELMIERATEPVIPTRIPEEQTIMRPDDIAEITPAPTEIPEEEAVITRAGETEEPAAEQTEEPAAEQTEEPADEQTVESASINAFASVEAELEEEIPEEQAIVRPTEEEPAIVRPAEGEPAIVRPTEEEPAAAESEPLTQEAPGLSKPAVGDEITWGSFEQDGNTSNGKEPLTWLVLDVKEDKALVISKFGLMQSVYNEMQEPVTWAESSLRKYLNEEFIEEAFTEAEQSLILKSAIPNNGNLTYGVNGGEETEDWVFLLSKEEAIIYFATPGNSGNNERQTDATRSALDSGSISGDGRKCTWWLRTPGISQTTAVTINIDGTVNNPGALVSNSGMTVRPAMWLQFK